MLINTSFNVRGEPIVCTPEDAYRCFMATDMDVLGAGPAYSAQVRTEVGVELEARAQHLAQFQLD